MSELITQEFEIGKDKLLDFTTNKIKGRLNYIQIFVDNQIQLKITLHHSHDFVIYESSKIVEDMYLPIRLRPINNQGEGFNYTHIRIKFNDSLRFLIQGNSGTKFKAIIDWDKDSK